MALLLLPLLAGPVVASTQLFYSGLSGLVIEADLSDEETIRMALDLRR
jgi:hypothetical protein